jgi:hypothetical protein
MKHLLTFLLFTCEVCTAQNYQFINGQWFNGTGFENAAWFSAKGLLTKSAPTEIDSVIDLKGYYIVPPYGEAHNHNVSPGAGFKELSNKYLRDGIFYVKNPNSLNEAKTELINSGLILNPVSIDASFSNGGLTSTQGHPSRFFANTPQGEGNFYHFIDSEAHLESRWPLVLSKKPDFIKTYLLFSEELKLRRDDPKYDGFRGLDPSLLKLIVAKAHVAGLRVSTHVETAYDFHEAIAAGVDEINHLPGFRGDPMRGAKASENDLNRFLITVADAQLAASNGVVVVTTIGDTRSLPFFMKIRKLANKLHKQNLTTLRQANVKIALGSDSYEKNSLIEVRYLEDLDVFTNLQLLKMFCETTALTIFPDRKIGAFREGYEASFLILRSNPLQSISNVDDIRYSFKSGLLLKLD